MEAAESPRPLLHAAPHAAPIGVSLRSLSLHVQSRVVSSQSAARDGGGGGGGTSGGANCILHNLTGDIPAGGLFLVYGGSGSGKTSLLNALAGRLGAAGYRLTGAVLFNGAPPDAALRERVGYVLQTDFLHEYLTVRETLRYAARLRLPDSRSAADKLALVEALILELGLKDVADTRCGGRHGRGISGGEARRVTTAVQLVTDPALLFCDEPSTGLDAFSTLSLVETLAAVAARGRTVVCTLHQPRADVLSLFHASLLLSKGRAVYFGPAADMVPHFAALGHACPVHTNAGDFLLDLSSVDMRTPAAEAATRATVARLLDAWADRAEQQTGSIDGTQGAGGGGFGGGAGAGGDDALASLLSGVPRAVAASRRAQTAALLSRGALNAARDVRTLGGLLLECVAVGLSIGGIFFRIGGTPSDMVSRASLAHLVCSAQAYQFMVFSLHVVAAELAVYDHETADGMYGVVAFLTARYAVLLPHLLVFPTIFALIVFFMAGLRHEGGGGGALPMFLAVVIAAHAISFSLALACTATHRSFAQASLMANLFFIFCRLTSGLLMQLGSVPYWLAWVKRISFLNFTYRIIAVNEFSHHTWPCPEATPAACVSYDGDATLKRLGVSHDVADAAVALVVEFLALVLLTAAALAWRPRVEARAQALMLAVRLGGARDVDDAAPGTSATASAEERLAAAAAVPVHLDEGAVAALHALAPALDSLAELHFRAFTPVTVGLRDVGLSLLPPRAWRRGQRREEGKVLLRSITLTLRPGQLTGVLGASGSGKSSLLNTLAARVLPGEGTVSGAMLFNGVLLRPAATRAVVGYVTQHDALMPMLTVFETMHFAARLRLPEDMCAVAKLARVETVLAELGLKECAGTMVGAALGSAVAGARRRGASGGERRRVSIAVQMLTDPAVLLADEPTSGLDAFTALNIGTTLARLAEREGRTVVATLHAPREGLFAMLHQVVLLAQGCIVYAGAGGDAALGYFERRGHACPPHCNPADFVVDAASIDTRCAAAEAASRSRVAALIETYAAHAAAEKDCRRSGGSSGGDWAVDEEGRGVPRSEEKASTTGSDSGAPPGMARPMGSLHATTRLLLRRSYLNLSRQPVMLASRMLQAISFGSVLCIFFTRLRDDGPRAVQNRVGLLYELLTLVYVGMLNCIAIFPAERDVFYAEAAEGAYGTAAFVLTYTALEVPCEIASALVFGALVGPIAGMRASPRHFFMLVYGLACVMNAGESIGIAFCALTSHAAVSVTLMSVLLSLLAVMAGFFSVGMPPLLQAINYASVLRYMARALGVNEFAGLQLEGGMSGDAALALYRLRPQEAARDTWLLGLLTVLYRLLAAAALHASKRRHV